MVSMSAVPQVPCCGARVTPTMNPLLSSGRSTSASEKQQSETSTTSYPHISGVVSEFWDWMADAANYEWAASIFPVERGYSDRNIFVTKLPPSFDDRDLLAMFGTLGEVVSAKVMLNVNTGASKGTGFVQYACAADALRARTFLRLRPTVTEPAMPEVGTQWALNKHDGGVYGDRSRMARKLFLRNIPVSVTNDEMRSLVTAFGDVAEVTLHADTYDAAAATPAASRGKEGVAVGQGETGVGSAADAAATAPPNQQRSLRICFITFLQPGNAAKACAALHNTKPFRACGDIPVMAKIAEDNNARQARHQQGAMNRPDLRATSPGLHRSARLGQKRHGGAASPVHHTAMGWGCGQSGSLANGSVNSNSASGLNGVSDSMGYSGSAVMPAMMTGMQPGYAPDASYGNCKTSCNQPCNGNGRAASTLPTTCQTCPTPSAAPAPIASVAGGFARLTFQPQNPYAAGMPSSSGLAAAAAACSGGAALTLDPAALATSGTPRALSTTASPTMKLPMVVGATERLTAGDSRRPSRLTLSSFTSSGKARIPATTTSAPTSARRPSRDAGATRSPLHGRSADGLRRTSSVFADSTSVSGVYSTEALTSPSLSTLPQSQPPTRPVAAVVAAAVAAAASPLSPRDAAGALGLSSRSSETGCSSPHRSCSRGASGRLSQPIDVRVTRVHRVGDIGQQQQQQQRSSCPSAWMRASPRTSPHTAAQVALLPSPGFVTATTPLSAAPPLSLTRPAWEGAVAEDALVSPHAKSLVSPYAKALAASHNTPTATPTRYRNNPYAMSIVLEKAASSSFAEA